MLAKLFSSLWQRQGAHTHTQRGTRHLKHFINLPINLRVVFAIVGNISIRANTRPSPLYSCLLFAVSVKFYAHTHTNRNVNPNQNPNPNPNPKLLLIWRKINRQIARTVEEEQAKLRQQAMWAINVSRHEGGEGGREGQQRRQRQEEATVASQIKFAFQIRRSSSSARFVDSN